jgi:hypothetical protein
MGGPSIPWSLISPYASQAKDNHDQTLERLAERGGLDPGELWCIVHGRRLREMPEARITRAWFAEWCAANDGLTADLATLRATLAEVTRERDEARAALKDPHRHPDCYLCSGCRGSWMCDRHQRAGFARTQRIDLECQLRDMHTDRDSWKAKAEAAEKDRDDLRGSIDAAIFDFIRKAERERIASWIDDQFNGRDDDPHNLIADVITAIRALAGEGVRLR